MASKQYFTLKEVRLNNNCPECYSNDGLVLTFKQRFVENSFYKAISTDRVEEMHCHTCHTDIFPIRWTDGIDQVVAYQRRAVQSKPKSLKLKKLAWVFIIVDLLIIVLIVLFSMGILTF